MKKFIIGVAAAALAFASIASPAFAKVETVSGSWDLTGECEIAYTGVNIPPGPYIHTYDITSMNLATGDFSGTGFYNPDHSYTEALTGTSVGSSFEFHSLYTGTNTGYYVDALGTINSDGILTGTALSSSGQTFTLASSEACATQFTGNHGQYVSSQEDKQSAAQSRVGMPVQSKGHTK